MISVIISSLLPVISNTSLLGDRQRNFYTFLKILEGVAWKNESNQFGDRVLSACSFSLRWKAVVQLHP